MFSFPEGIAIGVFVINPRESCSGLGTTNLIMTYAYMVRCLLSPTKGCCNEMCLLLKVLSDSGCNPVSTTLQMMVSTYGDLNHYSN